MSEIVEKRLVDLSCNFLSGFAFKSADFTDIGIPLIKIGNIQNKTVTIDPGGTCISRSIMDDKISKYYLSNNDVLIAMTGQGSVGRVGKLKLKEGDSSLLNQRVGKFICDEINLNKDYLYYILTSEKYQDFLFNTGSGSGQPNLSPNLILDTEIPWFEYEEQKSIASILSSLDDKIDLLHRQNKTLEAMAETLFRQWFVEGAGDWESGKVNDLIDVLSGFAFKSTSFVESGIYRLMTIKAVQDGYLETNNADRIAEIPANMPSYCNLQEGDILLSLTGNVGRCCLVDDEKLLLNQRVAKLRPKNGRDHAFSYVMFRQASMRAMLEEMAKGTAQANLSPVEMANMEIQIPPEYALLEFSLVVTPMLNKLLFNKREIKTLEKLRDGLLPKLMSGEMRVS